MTTLLTTAEVAEMCRTSVETCRYWRWQGTGPRSFKVGRRVLYKAEDVEAWLAQRYQTTSAGGDHVPAA